MNTADRNRRRLGLGADRGDLVRSAARPPERRGGGEPGDRGAQRRLRCRARAARSRRRREPGRERRQLGAALGRVSLVDRARRAAARERRRSEPRERLRRDAAAASEPLRRRRDDACAARRRSGRRARPCATARRRSWRPRAPATCEAVQLLLEHGSDPNAAETVEGQTALMWAAAEGHLDVVDVLLRAGADPNLKARTSDLTKRSMRTDFPSGGFTALMWAARNGNEAMVRRLVDGRRRRQSDERRRCDGHDAGDRQRPLRHGRHAARARRRCQRRLALVRDRDARRTDRLARARRLAVAQRSSEPAHGSRSHRALLAAGADPNKPFTGQMHNASMCCDTKGSGTPFFRAAVAADVETMKLLIARGADLEWAPPPVEGMPPMPFGDNTGLTPLMVGHQRRQGTLDGRRPRRHSREQDRHLPRARQPQPRRRREAVARSGREPQRRESERRHGAAHRRARRAARGRFASSSPAAPTSRPATRRGRRRSSSSRR